MLSIVIALQEIGAAAALSAGSHHGNRARGGDFNDDLVDLGAPALLRHSSARRESEEGGVAGELPRERGEGHGPRSCFLVASA